VSHEKTVGQWDKWDKNSKPFVFNKTVVPACPSLGQIRIILGQKQPPARYLI